MQVLAIAQSRVNASIHKFVICFYGRLPYVCINMYELRFMYIYVILCGVLFKIMVPQNCPYATLSRTFRALSRPSRIGTGNYDHVFVCIFGNVIKIYRRIVLKIRKWTHSPKSYNWNRLPDSRQRKPMLGQGGILEPFAKLQPFADFLPIKIHDF